MELRFVNPDIKARITRLLREDSRRTLSDIACRLKLDVRIVDGYLKILRKEFRFTIVRRSPEEMSRLNPYLHARSGAEA